MRINSLCTLFMSGFLLAGSPFEARAQLPPDQSIEYVIRQTPTDPESTIVFLVRLELTAMDSDATGVGWEIGSAEFRQPGTGGASDTVWSDILPAVDSPDGLWWVDHADNRVPQESEFVLPPWLMGTAPADDPANDDLDYDFEGVTYTPPPAGAPFENTGALDYSFTLAAAQEPVEEGDDEPVEVPPATGDPA